MKSSSTTFRLSNDRQTGWSVGDRKQLLGGWHHHRHHSDRHRAATVCACSSVNHPTGAARVMAGSTAVQSPKPQHCMADHTRRTKAQWEPNSLRHSDKLQLSPDVRITASFFCRASQPRVRRHSSPDDRFQLSASAGRESDRTDGHATQDICHRPSPPPSTVFLLGVPVRSVLLASVAPKIARCRTATEMTRAHDASRAEESVGRT